MRNYAADPSLRYGSALSDGFRLHCEALYGPSLQWFFNQWHLQAVRPTYQWQWGSHLSGDDTILDVSITQTQVGSAYTMPIELRIFNQCGSPQIVTVWNNLATQSFQVNMGNIVISDVTFDPDNWILANETETTAPPAPQR